MSELGEHGDARVKTRKAVRGSGLEQIDEQPAPDRMMEGRPSSASSEDSDMEWATWSSTLTSELGGRGTRPLPSLLSV